MAFLLSRGRKILLMHGSRDLSGQVRQVRLHTFPTPRDLRHALDDWDALCARLQTEHPSVRFDWNRLKEQAERYAGPADQAPPVAPHLGEARRRLARAMRDLRHLAGRDGRPEERLALGSDVRELVSLGLQVLDQVQTGRPSSYHAVLPLLHPLEEVEALVERAEEAASRRRWAQARKLFEKARTVDPLDPDILTSEGVVEFGRGRFEAAETLFLEAFDLARHQLPWGRRSFHWGELEVRPYVRALYNLGLALSAMGRLEEAVDRWEECVRICPTESWASECLGGAYHRLGRLDEAAEWYERNLHFPDSRFSLAALHLDAGRTEQGLVQLLAAIPHNFYIPLLLLDEPLPQAKLRHFWGPADLDWARQYVENAGDLWSRAALQALRLLWAEPEVAEAVHELIACARGSALATTPDERARAHDGRRRFDHGLLNRGTTTMVAARLARTLTGSKG